MTLNEPSKFLLAIAEQNGGGVHESFPTSGDKNIFSLHNSFRRKSRFSVSKNPVFQSFFPPHQLRKAAFWHWSKVEKLVKWKIGSKLDTKKLGKHFLDIPCMDKVKGKHFVPTDFLKHPKNEFFVSLCFFHSEKSWKKERFLICEVGKNFGKLDFSKRKILIFSGRSCRAKKLFCHKKWVW